MQDLRTSNYWQQFHDLFLTDRSCITTSTLTAGILRGEQAEAPHASQTKDWTLQPTCSSKHLPQCHRLHALWASTVAACTAALGEE